MDEWYSPADRQYIRENYQPLGELVVARGFALNQVQQAIAGEVLPRPPYILDGSAWVPVDYLSLWEMASAQGISVQQLFRDRYGRARQMLDGETPDPMELDETWSDYLGGDYAVCLWAVTPENIACKGHLITVIRALLRSPKRDDRSWQQRLRHAVSALDRLERPFAAGDQLRFGAVSSRMLYVDAPKAYFPEAFQAE